MSRISVIIACVNDPDLGGTLASLWSTTKEVEIIVIDDCSASPVKLTCPQTKMFGVQVITNTERLGCGKSRHIGAIQATGEYLLFVDSHSRFEKGWYDKALSYIEGHPQTLWCGICLQPEKWPDIASAKECYHGATLNIFGPDPNKYGATQVLEPNWLKKRPEDLSEIPCVIGACYFIPREWFLKLSPLQHLKTWGMDEPMLSLSTWLAGGDVRFLPVRIGHKYQDGAQQRKRFTVARGVPTWNKLFAINCLFPNPLNEALFRKLRAITPGPEWTSAVEMIGKEDGDGQLFQTERARLQGMFTRSIAWYSERFSIPLPA